jgi:probable phosphoglycerate mutase
MSLRVPDQQVSGESLGAQMTVYVVRHGEAVGNREGRFLGQVDPPLTEAGCEQAHKQGAALKGLGIARILSSDLVRAVATASIIGEALDLPVESTAALREVSHGVIDGWLSSDIQASEHGPARDKDKYNYRPPGGESYADIEARILSVLTPPCEQPMLLVTHLGPMRVMLHRLCGYTQMDAVSAKIGHDGILALTRSGASWSGAFLRGPAPDR